MVLLDDTRTFQIENISDNSISSLISRNKKSVIDIYLNLAWSLIMFYVCRSNSFCWREDQTNATYIDFDLGIVGCVCDLSLSTFTVLSILGFKNTDRSIIPYKGVFFTFNTYFYPLS